MAAYIYMTDPAQGEKYLEALRELDQSLATTPPTIHGAGSPP
jgi:hypothetical protein